MEKVLVFGGNGFLGSYLSQELVHRGYHVVIADIIESNLTVNIDYVFCDITSLEYVKSVIKIGFDYIYNLAGFANLDSAVNQPLETINLNVIGNLNVLEAIRLSDKAIRRYVYASSAYALNDKGSFYGISKLASEKIIEEYNKKFGLRYSILRYGSIYSERDFENNYIYSLISSIIKNKRIDHKGDGFEVREYIHASDVARMAVEVISDDTYIDQHLILTGIERLTRRDLLNMIREIIGFDFEVSYLNVVNKNHYQLSPYSFQATMNRKVVLNTYIDMGQGILECIKDIYAKGNSH